MAGTSGARAEMAPSQLHGLPPNLNTALAQQAQDQLKVCGMAGTALAPSQPKH